MNRLLFETSERAPDGTVTLDGARARHVRAVLRAAVGDTLKVGEINGLAGAGRILELTEDRVRLAVTLDAPAPEPWADLLLAAPRPKALKRLWPQLAALGVGRVVLLNAARVERAYFETHWARAEAIRPLLLEGLAQAGATRPPEVLTRRRFRPFVEDELDALFPSAWRILAHPGAATPLTPPPATDARPLLAVGPEGGWPPFERELLMARGFQPFALGPRTLRSDTACVALLSVIAYCHARPNTRPD
jgi:RsmE family RNA methyltransferase